MTKSEMRNAYNRCRHKLAAVKKEEKTPSKQHMIGRLFNLTFLYRHGDRSASTFEAMCRVTGRGRHA